MKIGVLGTGMVGMSLATKLASMGNDVMMGSRAKDNPQAVDWAKKNKGKNGTFKDAAAFGEMILLCVKGEYALDTLKSIAKDVEGKTVIDVTNALDFSKGAPRLFVCNDESLAEQLQKAVPKASIVKTLNIVNASIMTEPKMASQLTMLVAGNNDKAKDAAKKMLKDFGWKDVIDLGDLTAARGMEMLILNWVRLYNTLKTANFGIKIVRG